jgi:hypothetical protein
MLDEDDTVKDLAVKTLEDLWFQDLSLPSSPQKSKANSITNSTQEKGPLLAKVAVIMGVSANFKDRQSPLEDLLHKIMVDKEGNEAMSLHTRYAEFCGTLIDGLVDASDLPGFVRRFHSLPWYSDLRHITTIADCCELRQDNSSFHVCLSSDSVRVERIHTAALLEKCCKCMVSRAPHLRELTS